MIGLPKAPAILCRFLPAAREAMRRARRMMDVPSGAGRLPMAGTLEDNAGPAHPSRLPKLIRDHLGSELRTLFSALMEDQQPTRFSDLIARLDVVFAPRDAAAAAAFREDLLASLPELRAFAISLAGSTVQADDLVQETVLRAWQHQDRYRPGSNFKAWTFTILRNQFYTDCRKRKREVEDADGVQAGSLVAQPTQEHGIDLQKVWDHLAKLSAVQREALLLVAAQGMSYEAAAEVIGCQVGTVKSRVSRARSLLTSFLEKPAARFSA